LVLALNEYLPGQFSKRVFGNALRGTALPASHTKVAQFYQQANAAIRALDAKHAEADLVRMHREYALKNPFAFAVEADSITPTSQWMVPLYTRRMKPTEENPLRGSGWENYLRKGKRAMRANIDRGDFDLAAAVNKSYAASLGGPIYVCMFNEDRLQRVVNAFCQYDSDRKVYAKWTPGRKGDVAFTEINGTTVNLRGSPDGADALTILLRESPESETLGLLVLLGDQYPMISIVAGHPPRRVATIGRNDDTPLADLDYREPYINRAPHRARGPDLVCHGNCGQPLGGQHVYDNQLHRTLTGAAERWTFPIQGPR
jgi:hypothetical protein